MKFKKEIEKIFKEYSLEYGILETRFGRLEVTYSVDRKFYSVFMRFIDDFDIELFFKLFSRNEDINRYSKNGIYIVETQNIY